MLFRRFKLQKEKGPIYTNSYPRIFKGNIECLSKSNTNSRKSQSLHDAAEYKLSLVIPAYNEEKRLKTMLDDTLIVLKSKTDSDNEFNCEVILVDDGSKDETVKEYKNIVNSFGQIKKIDFKLIKMGTNSGKGRAVSEVN